MNIFIITSVINIEKNERNIYTVDQRFDQTIQTIKSIRQKVYRPYLVLVDLKFSSLSVEKKNRLIQEVDKIIDLTDDPLAQLSSKKDKSLGDIYLTVKGVEYVRSICEKNGNIHSVSKISGRYYLNSSFKNQIFEPESKCFASENFVFKCFASENLIEQSSQHYELIIRKIIHDLPNYKTVCYETKLFIFLFSNDISTSLADSSRAISLSKIIELFKKCEEGISKGIDSDIEHALYRIASNDEKMNVIELKNIGVSGNIAVDGESQNV